MKKILLFTSLIIAIAFTACSTNKNITNAGTNLTGAWQLATMPAAKEPLKMLYPTRMPTINFDVAQLRVSGNSGCNSYGGSFGLQGNKLDFSKPLISTKMACMDGMAGEGLFLNMLQTVNNYSVENGVLLLKEGNNVVTTYTKK